MKIVLITMSIISAKLEADVEVKNADPNKEKLDLNDNL
jgi:hypothetical protein